MLGREPEYRLIRFLGRYDLLHDLRREKPLVVAPVYVMVTV